MNIGEQLSRHLLKNHFQAYFIMCLISQAITFGAYTECDKNAGFVEEFGYFYTLMRIDSFNLNINMYVLNLTRYLSIDVQAKSAV